MRPYPTPPLLKVPKLTATRWCKTCGDKHNEECDLIRVTGPDDRGRERKLPTRRRG